MFFCRRAIGSLGKTVRVQDVWHQNLDLTLAKGTQALLAGVLVFDLEFMSVGTIDRNPHWRSLSST